MSPLTLQLLFNMLHVPEEVLSRMETLDRDADETALLRFLCHVGHARAIDELYCILLGGSWVSLPSDCSGMICGFFFFF